MPTITRNRKAYHDYEIIEKYEAGIKLFGSEVKALKENKGNLTGTRPIQNQEFLSVMIQSGHVFCFLQKKNSTLC